MRVSRPILALLLFACSSLGFAQGVLQRLGQVVQAAHAQGGFDGVVIVSEHGHVLFHTAAGEANHSTHAPITERTTFRLASLTKQVTAVLVMQQVQAGSWRLDEPVREILPGVAPAVGRVTVQQLLQHVSGLPNPSTGQEDVVPVFYQNPQAGRDYLQRAATGFCAGPPVRNPDEKFEYNNCDYLVLGAMLEHATGMPFAELLQARVIRPLGLASWGIFTGDGSRPAAARGYGEDGKPELPQNPATYGSAGALYGNALDVARWNGALLSHRLLGPEATGTLFHGDRNLGGEALGCWSYDLPGTTPPVHLVERQGDIGGTRLLSLLLPEQDASIVIIANTERADLFNTYSRKGLGYDLVRAFTGR